MTQDPTPIEMVPIVIPVFGMLTGVIITGMVVLGPVGRAVGDILRHWLGGGRSEKQLAQGELDELHARLDQIQATLSEIAERQDFTERLLAQVRKEKALPGSGVDG